MVLNESKTTSSHNIDAPQLVTVNAEFFPSPSPRENSIL